MLVALKDSSPNVVVVTAEALYNLGEKDHALKALLKTLDYPNEMARCHALNAVDCIGVDNYQIRQRVTCNG